MYKQNIQMNSNEVKRNKTKVGQCQQRAPPLFKGRPQAMFNSKGCRGGREALKVLTIEVIVLEIVVL